MVDCARGVIFPKKARSMIKYYMHLLRDSTKSSVKLEEEVLSIGKRTKTTREKTFDYGKGCI